MAERFSKETFLYFDQAKRNKKNKKWFDANKIRYQESVREPFANLIKLVHQEFASQLPRVIIDTKKISQPCFRANRIPEDGTLIKAQSTVYLCEKPTSMFEWNPGIYFSIGQAQDDCLVGLGLYMVSGRQMSRLRDGLEKDFEEVDAILTSKKFKSRWGSLRGEKFKRFPKGFEETSSAAKYLWQRQFFLGQDLSRTQICSKNFTETLCKDLQIALPLLQWIRKTVGVYQGKTRGQGSRE